MSLSAWHPTWTVSAEKSFFRLPKRHQDTARRAVNLLLQDPLRSPNVKRLHGEFEGLYRLRVGELRLVFHLLPQAHEIRFIAIGFRQGMY